MHSKKCTKCNKIKHIILFRLRKDTGKYRGSCIDCNALYFSRNHAKNRSKKNARSVKWYNENKEVAKRRTKEWRRLNHDRLKTNRAKQMKAAKEKYHNDEEFRNRRKNSVKAWRTKNPSKVAEFRRNDNRKISTRISGNLRSRLRAAFKGKYKSGSAVRDLGCTIQEFKVYLESLWRIGMSWDNYGLKGWHIDHIIPLTNFDLTNLDHIKQACHYTNLQPLWASDNLKKGSKIS